VSVKDKKPVSKSKLLTLIKDLDWRCVKAALEEHPDLLEHRADKSANLLHLCCRIDIEKRGLSAADSIKTAGVLLNASLDINREAFTEGGWKATPLWYAVGRGKNLELAKYLLKRGADPEHCLWAAAFNDSPAAIRLLVRAGAVVDARGEETPFLFAVKWSHFESAKALLDAGADVNVQDGLGKTALHCMLKKRSDPKYVRMLLEQGARLDLEDHDGITAGSILSRMRSPEYQKLAKKWSSSI
jgi:ankyrin repeat protein